MAAIMDAFFFFNFSSNETIKPAWQVRGFSTPRKTSPSGHRTAPPLGFYKVKTETFSFVYILLFIFVSNSPPLNPTHRCSSASRKQTNTHAYQSYVHADLLLSSHQNITMVANWLFCVLIGRGRWVSRAVVVKLTSSYRTAVSSSHLFLR